MTLKEAIAQRQGTRATKANRQRGERAERRADEIAVVAEVQSDYAKVDRAGDVAIESHFQSLFNLVDTDAEKQAVAAAFAVWMRSERHEDLAVTDAVNDALETLRANNPFWLSGSEGAA